MEAPVKFNKHSEGFSLVEILVSILILALVMLALLEAVTLYTKQNMNNILRDEAVRITQDVLYDIRTQDYTSIASKGTITGNQCTTAAGYLPVQKKLRTGNFDFRVCWNVTEDSLRAHKTVTAVTSWVLQKQTYSHQASLVASNF